MNKVFLNEWVQTEHNVYAFHVTIFISLNIFILKHKISIPTLNVVVYNQSLNQCSECNNEILNPNNGNTFY